MYHTVQFQYLRSGSKTKPNHVSLQIGVINYSWHVDLDEDWEAVRGGAHTSILSAISCLFCVNICTFSCIALLKDARFSCVHLNEHTFAQIIACAGTYCYFKSTVTSYVMILNYVLQVSLQLHKFARPQCEVPVHDMKAHVGVEL